MTQWESHFRNRYNFTGLQVYMALPISPCTWNRHSWIGLSDWMRKSIRWSRKEGLLPWRLHKEHISHWQEKMFPPLQDCRYSNWNFQFPNMWLQEACWLSLSSLQLHCLIYCWYSGKPAFLRLLIYFPESVKLPQMPLPGKIQRIL